MSCPELEQPGFSFLSPSANVHPGRREALPCLEESSRASQIGTSILVVRDSPYSPAFSCLPSLRQRGFVFRRTPSSFPLSHSGLAESTPRSPVRVPRIALPSPYHTMPGANIDLHPDRHHHAAGQAADEARLAELGYTQGAFLSPTISRAQLTGSQVRVLGLRRSTVPDPLLCRAQAWLEYSAELWGLIQVRLERARSR